MLAPIRITGPAITPVSLVEARAHLRVDHADDDLLIEGLIGAAVDHLDGWTGILGRCLVEQEWRQDYEAAGQILPLSLGPIIEIVEVTYADAAGNSITIDPADYELKTEGGGRGGVMLRSGSASYGRPASAAYRAGYVTTPGIPGDGDEPAIPAKSTVPAALKVAILLLVGNWYANRETIVVGATGESLPFAVDALIAPFRRVGV